MSSSSDHGTAGKPIDLDSVPPARHKRPQPEEKRQNTAREIQAAKMDNMYVEISDDDEPSAATAAPVPTSAPAAMSQASESADASTSDTSACTSTAAPVDQAATPSCFATSVVSCTASASASTVSTAPASAKVPMARATTLTGTSAAAASCTSSSPATSSTSSTSGSSAAPRARGASARRDQQATDNLVSAVGSCLNRKGKLDAAHLQVTAVIDPDLTLASGPDPCLWP